MSGERDSFAHYLARMEALGFRPSSVLGQNFLLDPTLHRWLAERAAPTAASTVLEIGVGLGFLTRELAARAGRVVAVEIDDRLLQIAQQELTDCRNVQWVAGDALGGPGGSLLPAIPAALAAAGAGELLVVANLPYSVSGPLLAELMALDPLPARAVLLVQKEMAQRVAAPCGHADYGGLSALVQAAFTARSLRDVSPQVFRPRPKVTSSVLLLERRASGGVTDRDGAGRREFARFVRQLFQQRRKVLRTTLPRAAEAIGALPPELSAERLAGRAEQVDPDTLVAWWRGCRRVAGSA
ncbi:MAG: 16S rRNA (adenine(1518)-N(6)/adenine(1519)-N(6))-dimethyltransferase RsmA [Planctomycetes bacterium]|jgi:16S rRNA (adenine1518-N6/adenine1519-N6)-dimethyltransferase|nr:16S rRNA (adenine(1518)-N(6)/adenine(1519)-N(6))-dimethyltransferase RsmA [Planctomycetota bacterium]